MLRGEFIGLDGSADPPAHALAGMPSPAMEHAARCAPPAPTPFESNYLNYKLFRERPDAKSPDLFIASITDVEITPATWKLGPGKARTAVPGLISARSDEDLAQELLAGQPYFLSGADGERFDFELAGTGKAVVKTGNFFKIAIL